MATTRIYWKGHLRLSLVTIDIALHAATDRAAKLTLHQIHEPTGKRVRYEKVVPGHGPVDPQDIVKGYKLGGDNYVVLQPEELEEISLETRRAIKLVQFVEYSDIDPRYFERPYYVTPQGEISTEGFVVIRDALRKAKKAGLGQMAMRGREYLVAVRPCGRGLLLETLRYAGEVRDAETVFDDIPDVEVDQEMLELADELIRRKSAPFDPSAFEDSYSEALRELIERKREGEAVVGAGEKKKTGQSAQVIDLRDALKKSLASNKKSKSKSAKSGAGKRGGDSRRAKSSRRKSAKKTG